MIDFGGASCEFCPFEKNNETGKAEVKKIRDQESDDLKAVFKSLGIGAHPLNEKLKDLDNDFAKFEAFVEEELKDVDDIFFAKIDIEGFDIVALRQILRLRNLPMYVSVENGSPKMLDLFAGAGYKKFKLSNQKYVKYQKIPLNSLHGNLVDHQFLSGSSGLWGEDLDGRWFPYDEMMLALKSIGEARKLTPNNVFAEIIGWFDLHACRDN